MADARPGPTIIAIDGEIVPPERATISVLDRGLLYGDGAFEVLRTWKGRAIDLDRHLDRLCTTAGALQLRVDRDVVARSVAEAVVRGGATPDREVRIRIIVTRGPGALSAPLASLSGGRTIVIVEPLQLAPPVGIRVAIVDAPVARRGPGHKTLAYLDHILARELARQAGADEAIRLDPDGNVVEGATSNIFAVIRGEVVTPPVDAGALPGIVRGRILELYAVSVRPLSRTELVAADELFITSSIRGVAAVTSLDGSPRAEAHITPRIASGYVACMLERATI